ncbi:MAG: hypothetical protein ACRDQA_24955, partial [Nocardioidaceae bacterium]
VWLNQPHMAGPVHMRTDIHGATHWSDHDFRPGLNKWMAGNRTGFYVENWSPRPMSFIWRSRPMSTDGIPLRGGAELGCVAT